MLDSFRFATLSLWILPPLLIALLPAACSGSAEKNDAPSSTESELRSNVSAPCEPHQADAGPELPAFVLVPVPMPPAILMMDPVSPKKSELMRFKLVNRGTRELFVEELSFDLSMVCAFLQTVRLETGDGVLSDDACHAMTSFTADTSIPPGESETFSVTGIPRNDFEGLLPADQAIRAHDAFVTDLVSFRTPFGLTTLEPRYPSNEISLAVPHECPWEGEGCSEAWEGDPLFEVLVCDEQEPSFRIARNDLFIVPFSVTGRDIEGLDEPQAVLRFRIDGPPTVAGTVAVEIGSDHVMNTVTEENLLTVTVPILDIRKQYRLFFSVPGYRGNFRLTLESANVLTPTSISVVGCYPQHSQTLLLLPRVEWESRL